MTILLSICIPTYNRADFLDISLKHITEDDEFIKRDDIEIIISDNASPDNTEEVCKYYVRKFPNKIRYHRNDTNIGNSNFPLVLSMARGKFAKLHNDTVYFRKGRLKEMLRIIEENQDVNAIYFSNGDISNIEDYVICKNADELFSTGTHWLTWIGSFCCKTEKFKKLDEPMRFAERKLAQLDMLLRLVENTKCIIYNKPLMHIQSVPSKAKYSCAEIFGENYFYIIKMLIKERVLSEEIFNDSILKEELNYITPMYFNFRNLHTKEFSTGYFKYLYKYYWNKPYFYFTYIKNLLLKICYIPYCFAQNGYFGKKSKQILDFYLSIIWKLNNKHNEVVLKNPKLKDFVKVGQNSKGLIDIQYSGERPTEILHIGNNVIIEDGVKFILQKEDSEYTKQIFAKDKYILNNDKNEEIIIGDNVKICAKSIIKAGSIIKEGSIVSNN